MSTDRQPRVERRERVLKIIWTEHRCARMAEPDVVDTLEEDLTGVGPLETDDAPGKGCLAGTALPDNPEGFANCELAGERRRAPVECQVLVDAKRTTASSTPRSPCADLAHLEEQCGDRHARR